MSARETVARNAIILMGTQVVTWGLTLLLTIVLPRYLGPAAIGKFHLANSVWAIVGIVVAFGTNTLLVKEIARSPARLPELVASTLMLRSLLFVLGFLGVIAFLTLADYPPETRWVLYIVGLAQLVWLFIGIFESSLQGLERMEYVSLGNIAGKTVNTALCIGLVLAGQGINAVAAAGVVAALINLLIQFRSLRRLVNLKTQRVFPNLAGLRWLLKAGFPYLMTHIFLVIYMEIDIVIISLLIHDAAVGWYGAADQLFGTFLFVPTVVMTAVFPALSRRYAAVLDDEAESWAPLYRAARRTFDLLVVLSIPIGLGVLAIADPLVVLLFGKQFANSGPILALMGIVLILTYLNILLGQFLISMDRQNRWTVVMAIATVATLPLDLWLIPLCDRLYGNGGIGGSISFIITEGGMMIAGLVMLPRGVLSKSNAWRATRALLAGLAMVAGIWWARDLFLGIPIALGALIYTALAWPLRLIQRDDIELAQVLMQKATGRLRRYRTAAADTAVGHSDGC
jgi:O-antigen/teichoic acid export membrane protein